MVRFLEVPLKAQKAHSHGMGFCCLRARAKLAWVSGRNDKRMPAKAGMSFLYFQAGDQRNSERPCGARAISWRSRTPNSLLKVVRLPSEVELVDVRIVRYFSKINPLPAHSSWDLHL